MAEPIRFNDAEAYEQGMGVWSNLVGGKFLEWIAPQAGLHWADIGCGTGAFTELVTKHCAPGGIDAVDPSEAQLAFARARPTTRSARFHLGDAMALPFADGQFDVALMALVIFFVPEPERGAAEMRRVVRPGGTVCAYVWDIPGGGTPIEPFWAEIRAAGVSPMIPPRSDVSTLPALHSLWTGAGLEGVETRAITAERSFADFETYWRLNMGISAVGPSIAAMPPDDAARLKDRLRAKVPAGATGRITLSARANAVRGTVPAS